MKNVYQDMQKGLEHKVKSSSIWSSQEAPEGLYSAILLRIQLLQRRSERIRASLLALVAVFSGVALVPAFQYAASEFYASGFYDYASLLLSNHGLALTYWREFSLSLIESLPSLATLILLALTGALVWSAVHSVRHARLGFTRAQLS